MSVGLSLEFIRRTLIVLSLDKIRKNERDTGYRKHLTEEVVEKMKLHRYGSFFFRKRALIQGREFLYYPVPYELFVLCMRAHELLVSRKDIEQDVCWRLYYGIITKGLAACDAYGFMIEDRAAVIFANSQDTSDCIKQRKMQWIKSYIGKHVEDVHNLQTVFEVIAIFFPSDRKVFLLELINYTKDIELFKKIPLFPSSASWSGSEVPLIDKKIEFLSNLIISFKGVELIEHRAYLKEMKDFLKTINKML